MKTFLAIVALALTGILSAQEITPQRGVSFNATGILPAHDHSSPRNGAISGAAKLAIVNVGDQNTAFTLDNTLDGTSRAPFIQFRKRKTAGTPAAVGAVLGQLTFDSDNVAGTSAEIRSTVRVIGSNGVWPAGSSLDFMTAPGNASTVAQSRLYIAEGGNVGIGTAAPGRPLDVNGAGVVRGTFDVVGGTATFYNAGDNRIDINSLGVGSQSAVIYSIGGVNKWNTGMNNFVSGELYEIGRPGASAALTIDRSDRVGVGTPTPVSKLHVSSGTIRIDGTGAPTTGGALCLNAGGAMSKCTTAPDASGNCTCP